MQQGLLAACYLAQFGIIVIAQAPTTPHHCDQSNGSAFG